MSEYTECNKDVADFLGGASIVLLTSPFWIFLLSGVLIFQIFVLPIWIYRKMKGISK